MPHVSLQGPKREEEEEEGVVEVLLRLVTPMVLLVGVEVEEQEVEGEQGQDQEDKGDCSISTEQGLKDCQVNTELPMTEMDKMSTRQEGQERNKIITRR